MNVVEGDDGRAQFSTTEKGLSFLAELTRLNRAIDEIMNETDRGDPQQQPAPAIPQLARTY